LDVVFARIKGAKGKLGWKKSGNKKRNGNKKKKGKKKSGTCRKWEMTKGEGGRTQRFWGRREEGGRKQKKKWKGGESVSGRIGQGGILGKK